MDKKLFEYIFKSIRSIDFISLLLPAILIASLIPITQNLYNSETKLSPKDFYIPIVALTTIFTIRFIIKFLNNDKLETETTVDKFRSLRANFEYEKEISIRVNNALEKNPQILNIQKEVYEKVLSNLEKSLINKLEERFQTQIENEFIIKSIQREIEPLTSNTERYINRIQRNSIVNLSFGILGTIGAISFLAITMINAQTFVDINSFLIHFIPRLSFGIFIQIFAYFFLRLYRSNLEDAKYFQNELTNLVAKSASIKIGFLTNKDQDIKELLKDLSTTERNFKLLKEESIVNLEKSKIDNASDSNLISVLKDIVSKHRENGTK